MTSALCACHFALIGTYKKPFIAIQDGITMGGVSYSNSPCIHIIQGFIQNFHQGGANVTLANVSGGEDFGGTLVLI